MKPGILLTLTEKKSYNLASKAIFILLAHNLTLIILY